MNPVLYLFDEDYFTFIPRGGGGFFVWIAHSNSKYQLVSYRKVEFVDVCSEGFAAFQEADGARECDCAESERLRCNHHVFPQHAAIYQSLPASRCSDKDDYRSVVVDAAA